MKLVFATNNVDKFKEVKQIMSKQIELLSLSDIGCTDEIEETGKTLEENAKIKAEFVRQCYKLNCFADDTGLEVEALEGAPGVYSARYAGENVSYNDNVEKLLNDLKTAKNRKAQFRTVIALLIDDNEFLFEGIVNGQIINEKKGERGFGYDPIFQPDGFNKTFAEMSLNEKNKISHRALAIKALASHLNKIVNI
ncbi:MAG: non-canonical purine NTP diphosphatase [Bacteroidia bacterium]|nr:non-canonical purine NTP diphosphatase [Bacteroidia bacterium]NNM16174.1 non-canonical purine NTP diphosphatase [Bacteroidia bacterium]